MPWPLWLSSDAFLAINQQRNILSSQRSSRSSTAWTKKQHWISTSHWIWQKESWISRSIGTRCCIGQQSKFFLRNSTKIECFESFTHQIKAITWIQTQINWMVFSVSFSVNVFAHNSQKAKIESKRWQNSTTATHFRLHFRCVFYRFFSTSNAEFYHSTIVYNPLKMYHYEQFHWKFLLQYSR